MPSVLFAGGGTLGPVTPLLAVADRLREADEDYKIAWVGTDSGPERSLIELKGIPFTTIPVAKLPRYLSTKLVTLPFDYLRARQAASRVLDAFRPRAIISAGGFTAVPIIQEAYQRRIPCLAHQLDAEPLLSNRLIVRHCRYVTTSFPYDRNPFPKASTVYHVPTPVRFAPEDLPSRTAACEYFGFNPALPVLFVMGGGTGAIALNKAMWDIESKLPSEIQIIHSTGKGKMERIEVSRSGYMVQEFFNAEEMGLAYAASDLIVSRAGFGAISECASLSKCMILVPLPNSPQERNVHELDGAVIPVRQSDGFSKTLHRMIVTMLEEKELRDDFGDQLHDRLPTDRGDVIVNLVKSMMV